MNLTNNPLYKMTSEHAMAVSRELVQSHGWIMKGCNATRRVRDGAAEVSVGLDCSLVAFYGWSRAEHLGNVLDYADPIQQAVFTAKKISEIYGAK
jgi:hypothetical protein